MPAMAPRSLRGHGTTHTAAVGSDVLQLADRDHHRGGILAALGPERGEPARHRDPDSGERAGRGTPAPRPWLRGAGRR